MEEQPSPGPGVAGRRPHPLALLPLAEGARNYSWCKGILLSVHAREFLFGNLHGRGLLYTHTQTHTHTHLNFPWDTHTLLDFPRDTHTLSLSMITHTHTHTHFLSLSLPP